MRKIENDGEPQSDMRTKTDVTFQRRSNMLNTRIDGRMRTRLEHYAREQGLSLSSVVKLSLEKLLSYAWQLEVPSERLEQLDNASPSEMVHQLLDFLENQRDCLKLQLEMTETQLRHLKTVLNTEPSQCSNHTE
jgi:antitoxin component of RelBE/YafQ-DinJ toxin-antitoxin module